MRSLFRSDMETFWNGGYELLVLAMLVLAIKVDDYIKSRKDRK